MWCKIYWLYTFWSNWDHPRFWRCSCCSGFSFLCCVLYAVCLLIGFNILTWQSVSLFSTDDFVLSHVLKTKRKQYFSKCVKYTFRFIDDVLSLNIPHFNDYLYLRYTSELDIKYTIESKKKLLHIWTNS